MLKRIVLAGALAATAIPALASDASYDVRAQSAKAATGPVAPQTATQRDGPCACQKHHA